MEVFRLQAKGNKVYRDWLNGLRIDPAKIKSPIEIPFLPVEMFKSHRVVTGEVSQQAMKFHSSSTTGAMPSVHWIKDPDFYKENLLRNFRFFYGDPKDYCILALLPDGRTVQHSSLAFMCAELIARSENPESGFCPDAIITAEKLKRLKEERQSVLLIGLSYALLDLAETGIKLNENIIVMETGGMKGKRREMLKTELHSQLKNAFGTGEIHSEYGMTEMLSQGYSKTSGLFEFPPWVRVYLRQTDDPISLFGEDDKTGGICVIDLANIHSCAFLAIKDLGRMHEGKLELIGRYDHSDVRGCNLMY